MTPTTHASAPASGASGPGSGAVNLAILGMNTCS
jgi:hypothetical protein